MNWQIFLTTFIAIFFAELGDKTQLATLSMASSSEARWTVFAASALALVVSAAIAVLASGVIAQYVPPHWIKRIAGFVFLVLGIVYLFDGFSR